jgi:hypothetical protein
MAAEIKLSDGTTIVEPRSSANLVIVRLGSLGEATAFQPLNDAGGQTYFVNPKQVVYIRDVR